MDISDKALVSRYGDILHEIPELWNALRISELQSRPVRGGFNVRGHAGVSVDSGGGRGSELRIRVGRA